MHNQCPPSHPPSPARRSKSGPNRGTIGPKARWANRPDSHVHRLLTGQRSWAWPGSQKVRVTRLGTMDPRNRVWLPTCSDFVSPNPIPTFGGRKRPTAPVIASFQRKEAPRTERWEKYTQQTNFGERGEAKNPRDAFFGNSVTLKTSLL